MRTDRIKGQQWDALNLKEINQAISKALLIYPDGVSKKEADSFANQNQKYQKNEEYSAIDRIVSQDEISNIIEAYAIKDKTKGQIKDIQGNNFEDKISRIFSYRDNFTKWKTHSVTIEGLHFDVFTKMAKVFEWNEFNIEKVSATADKKVIGKLPSGGNPKTDVIIYTTDKSGVTKDYTISCKRSSNSSVSVHQYTADAFADVLDRNNQRLRKLLNMFQKAGSISAFGDDNTKSLTESLSPYLEKLCLWVLGGYGGGGSNQQCAKFILTYDNNDGSYSLHRTDQYCRDLLSSNIHGHFGTPFSWTYPSKRRGESIQLKCKIIK